MSEKPEALRLADECDWSAKFKAAKELRRLHAENERLHDELRQSSIDITRAEVERLKAENERLQNLLYEMLGELTALRAEKQMRDQIAALRREET